MPTYDYVCDACGHAFEHFQSMSSNRLRTCPKCKKRKLRRLIGSGAGVIFKGSGFYETDYKHKSGAGERKSAETRGSDESDSKSSDSGSDTGADTGSGGSAKPTPKKQNKTHDKNNHDKNNKDY